MMVLLFWAVAAASWNVTEEKKEEKVSLGREGGWRGMGMGSGWVRS